MKTKGITLGQYLDALCIAGVERDIFVDGIDSIAYCCTELTDEGKEHFKDALSLPIDEYGDVISYDDDDYDDENEDSRLRLAWDMLCCMAGMCPVSDYERWFVEE